MTFKKDDRVQIKGGFSMYKGKTGTVTDEAHRNAFDELVVPVQLDSEPYALYFMATELELVNGPLYTEEIKPYSLCTCGHDKLRPSEQGLHSPWCVLGGRN